MHMNARQLRATLERHKGEQAKYRETRLFDLKNPVTEEDVKITDGFVDKVVALATNTKGANGFIPDTQHKVISIQTGNEDVISIIY